MLSYNGSLQYNKYWASEVTPVQTKIVLEGIGENQLKCWNSRIHDYYVKWVMALWSWRNGASETTPKCPFDQ